MKRVAVIGPPGAGKSTFAKALASKTGLPLIHLDYYHLDSKHDYPHNHDAWNKLVLELAEQDEWIMEGNYGATYNERFNRADTIIYLDCPRRTAIASILKRRIKYHHKPRTEMPEDWKEKFDWGFIKYAWKFPGASTDKIKAHLHEQPTNKVVILKSREEAENYIKLI